MQCFNLSPHEGVICVSLDHYYYLTILSQLLSLPIEKVKPVFTCVSEYHLLILLKIANGFVNVVSYLPEEPASIPGVFHFPPPSVAADLVGTTADGLTRRPPSRELDTWEAEN